MQTKEPVASPESSPAPEASLGRGDKLVVLLFLMFLGLFGLISLGDLIASLLFR